MQVFERLRKHRLAWILSTIAIVFALVNVMAAIHAYSFTHYSDSDEATSRPEKLSLGDKFEVLLTGVSLPRPAIDRTPEDLALSFETHTFPSSEETLESWLVPCDKPKGIILMFAGYGSCKSDLLDEIAAIRGLGYACMAVDFRGSGGSTGNECSLGYFEAEDVAAAVRYCRRLNPEAKIVLLGQSMGGAAVMRAVAELGVEADALVIECVFDRMLTTIENRFTIMGLPPFPLAELLTFWGGALCAFDAFDFNPVDYASKMNCPTLFLQGSEDKRVLLDQALSVVESCPGSQGLVIFEGIGHQAAVEYDPVLWSESIAGFLKAQLDHGP